MKLTARKFLKMYITLNMKNIIMNLSPMKGFGDGMKYMIEIVLLLREYRIIF